jgi:reactive intermediate/imine deaminase
MRSLRVAAFGLATAALPLLAQSPKQVFPITNPESPFSAAVRADGLIYVSGIFGSGGNIAAQTKQVLDTIEGTLKTAGSSLTNAASVTIYLRNQSDFAAMNEVYRSYWKKDLPARTTVVTPLLRDGLLEVSVVAVPDGAERVVVNPAGWMSAANPYSYGIRTGNTLFLSGLLSRNGKDNTAVKGDISLQTKTVMENATAILQAAGMTLADVVSARLYLTDDAAFQPMNTVWRSFFPTNPPARATVKAATPSADYAIEATMIAVKGPKKVFGTSNPNLSAAIQVGNRLYLSGTLAATEANKGDVKRQTTETFARIESTMKEAGFNLSQIVDGVVYLPDLTKFAEMNAPYTEKLVKDRPARATVGAGLMNADAAVEIMFTAVK